MLQPIATGNSFHGRIYEFPGIAVDRFNVDASVYLLTHCHTDHLVGLGSKSFNGRVYCTAVTKDLLSLHSKFSHVLPSLVTVPLNSPFDVSVGSSKVKITLVATYHCPGSAMFLIEGEQYNVLVTGDLRAEMWWTDSLTKNPFLFPYTSGLKALDNIYIDTTFGYRGEPYIEMIPNAEGIAAVINLLNLYPQDDPDVAVWFRDTVLGFEEAWGLIVGDLNGYVQAPESIVRRHAVLQQHGQDPLKNVWKAAGMDGKKATEHIRCFVGDIVNSKPKFTVSVRQCINFNIIDYINSLLPIPLESLTSSERDEMEVLDTTSKGYHVVRFRNRQWLKVGKDLLPSEIKLVFSRHSSYTESRHFVRLFKPIQVYPCISSDKAWKNGFVMSRLFGDVCRSPKSGNFIYDVMQSTLLKFPPPEVMHRPLKTINRWNIEECENELRFVHRIWQSKQPSTLQPALAEFKGTRKSDDDSIKLSKYISNCSDTKFKQLVKQGEFLYKQYITHEMPGSRPHDRNYIQDLHRLDEEFMGIRPEDRYSFSTNEDSDCFARVSISLGSSSGSDNSKQTNTTRLVGEYGMAVKLPTVKDECGIPSSFNSVEVSMKPPPVEGLDDANICRITRQLMGNPDEYFSLTLQSVDVANKRFKPCK